MNRELYSSLSLYCDAIDCRCTRDNHVIFSSDTRNTWSRSIEIIELYARRHDTWQSNDAESGAVLFEERISRREYKQPLRRVASRREPMHSKCTVRYFDVCASKLGRRDAARCATILSLCYSSTCTFIYSRSDVERPYATRCYQSHWSFLYDGNFLICHFVFYTECHKNFLSPPQSLLKINDNSIKL